MKQFYEISWQTYFGRYVGSGKVSKNHIAEMTQPEDESGFSKFRTVCGREVLLFTRRGMFNTCWVHPIDEEQIENFGDDSKSYFTEDECLMCQKRVKNR